MDPVSQGLEQVVKARQDVDEAKEKLNKHNNDWKGDFEIDPKTIKLRAELENGTGDELIVAKRNFREWEKEKEKEYDSLEKTKELKRIIEKCQTLYEKATEALTATPAFAQSTVTGYPLASPSVHTSEHSLTPLEKATKRQNKINQLQAKKVENARLKAETIQFYYGQSQPALIKDMLTNHDFQSHLVHRSHIYQASWGEGKLNELILAGGFELEDKDITKDSPENMLLLHDHVETKYDCAQILIEYDKTTNEFVCRILDDNIRGEYIFVTPNPNIPGQFSGPTFGDFDGASLHFPSNSRPLRRLIQFRANINRLVAVERGYINPTQFLYLMGNDDWSPGTKAFFENYIEWQSQIPKG